MGYRRDRNHRWQFIALECGAGWASIRGRHLERPWPLGRAPGRRDTFWRQMLGCPATYLSRFLVHDGFNGRTGVMSGRVVLEEWRYGFVHWRTAEDRSRLTRDHLRSETATTELARPALGSAAWDHIANRRVDDDVRRNRRVVMTAELGQSQRTRTGGLMVARL